MKRLLYLLPALLILPRVVAAQAPPPAPPVPAAPPAAVVAPAVPPAPPEPLPAALAAQEDALRKLSADMNADVSGEVGAKLEAQIRAAEASVRAMERDGNIDNGAAERALEVARAKLDEMQARGIGPGPGPGPGPVPGPIMIRGRIDAENGFYDAGLMALQQHQFDQAITDFDRVVAQKNPRADGALYWKAFAQYKVAKTADALATLTSLRSEYPQSRYLGDAKVLEVDVRKTTGEPMNLDALAADEEIKILAIQGIQRTDPEKAIPLLEGVLTASNPLKVKKQAIYVLALSDDARAHQVLLRYAKGAGNPDLQAEAIRYIASRGGKQTTTSAELKDIYESTQDVNVRRAIIEAYVISGDKPSLVAIIANGGAPTDVRQSAISGLSALAAAQELWTLYQKEPDRDLRLQMVNAFGSMSATDQLLQIAKTDKDPMVRQRAIRSIGNQRSEKTGPQLVELYSSDQDKDTREAVIQALAGQNNAEALVTLARKETSLDLKRDLVRQLSNMAPRSKPAADYLMDVLGTPSAKQ